MKELLYKLQLWCRGACDWKESQGLRLPIVIKSEEEAATGNDFPIAYCVDIKGAGYAFESEPEPELAVEIMTFTSAVRAEPCVSKSKAGARVPGLPRQAITRRSR